MRFCVCKNKVRSPSLEQLIVQFASLNVHYDFVKVFLQFTGIIYSFYNEFVNSISYFAIHKVKILKNNIYLV